jgi:hypothetical protein
MREAAGQRRREAGAHSATGGAIRRRAGIGNMLGSPLDYSRSAAPIECARIRSASAGAEKRDGHHAAGGEIRRSAD